MQSSQIYSSINKSKIQYLSPNSLSILAPYVEQPVAKLGYYKLAECGLCEAASNCCFFLLLPPYKVIQYVLSR